MKLNGCRDVQNTGLQSIQTRRNTGKQGTQTRGTRHIFQSIPTSVAALAACINQAVFSTFCNLDSISYNYHTVGMLGKMCRVPLVCVPCLPVFFLVCMLCRPVVWTSLHPYIHLISFEIFLLACLCTFLFSVFSISPPTHLTRAPPTPTRKRCLASKKQISYSRSHHVRAIAIITQ